MQQLPKWAEEQNMQQLPKWPEDRPPSGTADAGAESKRVDQLRNVAGGRHEVVVTDVSIPFGSLVVILVKVALAAIPATLILAVLGAVCYFLLLAIAK